MPITNSSTGGRAIRIMKTALQTASSTKGAGVEARLEFLGRKANSLYNFIYGYLSGDEALFETDDEILNWTLVDVVDDLSASIWNLGSGFYKTAASCQRGALEMAVVSLYFQEQENKNKVLGGYNLQFSDWDAGSSSTPNWGTTKPFLKKHVLVKAFHAKEGFCVIESAHDFFKYLCSFTHSRAFSPEDGLGSNTMNMKSDVGEFHEEEFQRIATALDNTVAHIVSMWSVMYPHVVQDWESSNGAGGNLSFEELFCTLSSQTALEFARAENAKA
ncbi:hypothetical protein [Pseudomonas sp.]|uniref:hypothetical protein n=1 Tax=Pseudomonas sp. TaxID=306 RepID=UPI00258E8363|nr:hypothetical protein [Pseudomonas sp.]